VWFVRVTYKPATAGIKRGLLRAAEKAAKTEMAPQN
jgi:hypothetical protein